MAEDDKKPEEDKSDDDREEESEGEDAKDAPGAAASGSADEDEDEDGEEEAAAAEKPAAKTKSEPPAKAAKSEPPAKAAKSEPPAKAAKSEPAKAEEEDEDEDDGEEEEEEEAPAPPPKAAKAKAAPAREVEAERTTSPRRRAPLPPEPPPAAVGKTVSIFIVTMGVLSAGFYLLGAETGGDRTAPRWKTGQTVDVNITLVATDRNELACASDVEIAGRHCEFKNKTTPWDKVEDDKLLKPYTTTDNVQFVGAGLWSQPGLEVKKLPADRFTVKCKFTVEGEIKKPGIRWATRGGFSDKDNAWYAGVLKDCGLAP